jgi:hypothetical protein
MMRRVLAEKPLQFAIALLWTLQVHADGGGLTTTLGPSPSSGIPGIGISQAQAPTVQAGIDQLLHGTPPADLSSYTSSNERSYSIAQHAQIAAEAAKKAAELFEQQRLLSLAELEQLQKEQPIVTPSLQVKDETTRNARAQATQFNLKWATQNLQEVKQLRQVALQELSGVQVELSSDAKQYIEAELMRSEEQAETAIALAKSGVAKVYVQLIGDYAKLKVIALRDYLVGVGRGVYQGVQEQYEVMKLAFSQPHFIENVGRSIFALISHPLRFAELGRERFLYVTVMTLFSPKYPPEKLGEIRGRLLIEVLGAAAAVQPVGPVALRLGALSAEVSAAGVAPAIGELLVAQADREPLLAGEIAQLRGNAGEIALTSESIQRFGPLNPGPLHQIQVGNSSVAETFRSSSYFQVTTREPIKLYRVFGGEGARAEGSFWSRLKPTGPYQAVLDSALDPSWKNLADQWAEITLPAQTTFYEGIASEVFLKSSESQEAIGRLLGGGNQIYLPREAIRNATHLVKGKF